MSSTQQRIPAEQLDIKTQLDRVERKLEEVLELKRTLSALVDLIPNPIVRKLIKSRLD